MAKKTPRDCKRRQISFNTKSGRKVSFKARHGGQKSHGGKCATVKTTAQIKMGMAARLCATVGRPGTAANAKCMKAQFAKKK